MSSEIRTERKDDTSITRYQALSSFFVYAGLPLIEIQRVGPEHVVFVHHDPENEAPELELTFFEPQGGLVTTARELLRADHQVRKAMRELFNSEGRKKA